MCYKCINTYSNSRFIHKSVPSSFKVQFPCGYCSDCIRKKRSSWSLRAYYHAKSLFNKDSSNYVLFDTLTYSDPNLKFFHDIFPPALFNAWDFSCFDSEDVRNFMHRLRKNLSRGCSFSVPIYHRGLPTGRFRRIKLPAYHDSVGKLDYFLTSEYGTSEGCTHRPHYHVLFYVGFKIDPLELSKFVYHSWSLGRTDGFPFKSANYINSKRVIRANDPSNLKLIRYVSKYVGKDLCTFANLYKRVYTCFTITYPNWFDSYERRLEFNRFKKQVMPFLRSSNNFGASALDFEDFDYILDHNAITMPISSKGVIASIPLSLYYRRKLFYRAQKIEGKVRWFPTQLYFLQKKKRLDSSIVNLRNRIFSWKNAIGLDNATKIAEYQLLWRGRFIKRSLVDDSKIDFCNKLIPTSLQNDLCNNLVYFNYNTLEDRVKKRSFVTDTMRAPNLHAFDIIPRSWSHGEFGFSPPDDHVVVSSKTVPRFAGYDDILDDFYMYNYNLGVAADMDMRLKELQKQRYKELGFFDIYS